ncbi:MAG: Gldg family protein [Rhodospirillaceae bacterium]
MNALQNMDRKALAIAGLIVAAVFLFFANILATGEIKNSQIDLTENKLYTLSKGTKDIIAQIDEPLTFRYYYSLKFGEISPQHGNYATRVQEMLEQFELVSNGKIRLKVINPDPFSVEEDEAVKLGIQAVPLDQTSESGYFGLAANNSVDDRKTISFFDPQREQFLEYDLTRLVFELASPQKKKVGLITGLLLEADPLLQYKPWPIMGQIKQFFDVQTIDSDARVIPDDIDVLLLVHPRVNDDNLWYAIDQFAMRGGRILAFIDPQNETARMTPQAPPGAGSTDLKKLFDVWGIEFDPDKFVGDRASAIRVSAQVQGQDVISEYLSWNIFQSRNLNSEDVVTGQLTTIQVASAGHVELKEGSNLKMTPLLTTSTQAQHINAELVRGEIDPRKIMAQYKPDNKVFNIAARFSGLVKSAFPDGPPKPKDGDKKKDDDEKKPGPKGPHLKASKTDLNMIVLADSDLFTNRFWVRQQQFFGQTVQVPVSNNADFLVNALDNLSGNEALISLRSRGLSVRPFYKIQDLQNAAEDRYRETEQKLTAKLKDLQGKLAGLKVEAPGAQATLTSEQTKAFNQFRTEMLDVRKQLRDVQHNLRKDIESLDTRLKILNIWTVPLVVAVLAVILAIFRRRRYSGMQVQG